MYALTIELKRRISLLEGMLLEKEKILDPLRDSEKRYRRLFESAKDGILILDADTGRVVDANSFLLQLLGYSYNELCGQEEGVNFIQKPFSMKELAVKVRESLREK